MTDRSLAGKSRKLLPGLCSVLGTLILACVILAFLPITVPRFAGYEIYEVISGSMEPEIPVGSAVYVKPEKPEDIAEGEIVAFWSGDSVVTHRVVENRKEAREFVTKGDANTREDMVPVLYDSLIGEVKLHIPMAGIMMAGLSGMTGKICAAFAVIWGILLHILSGILQTGGE